MNTTNKISGASILGLRNGLNPMSCSHFKNRNLCALSKYNLNLCIQNCQQRNCGCLLPPLVPKEGKLQLYYIMAYSVLQLKYNGPNNQSSHGYFKVPVNKKVWLLSPLLYCFFDI